ncbi:MAG: cysteine desulfurase family protein [Candidatus Burarchaeum sp.]|nr:cysteine desulfurase family protein [Candidatus Burarchaeum sp.]MDO8339556.1 cysteine desulfurase family protein [Candidatus Burarchaeum sp.]
MKVYMDNGATTRVLPEVAKAMLPYMTEKYGNASSLHYMGLEAEEILDASRRTVAKCINAEPEEIIFTGCATEANNLAIVGACEALGEGAKGKRIITTKIEHASVGNVFKRMAEKGFEVVFLDVDSEGFVSAEQVARAIDDKTVLVSVIHANHEIGTIQDIGAIGKVCRAKGVLFHTDACQSFTKVPIDVKRQNVDLLTLNAHKIHGPKGVGALFVRRGIRLGKQIYGGPQEGNLRAGTENVPGIVGFAKAAEIGVRDMKKEVPRMARLRDALVAELLKIPNTRMNGPVGKNLGRRLCNNANITFDFIEGEALLMRLSVKGICVSTGSACSSKSLQPSHVLKAIGLEHEQAHGSIRFSLSKFNNEKEARYVVAAVRKEVEELRKMSAFRPGKSKSYYEERKEVLGE